MTAWEDLQYFFWYFYRIPLFIILGGMPVVMMFMAIMTVLKDLIFEPSEGR